MKYLSVCSGIEAATVAWHSLGWEPLAFSEIEPFPRKVLTHHYPDVRLEGDFTKLRQQDWIKDADILVGGTPCQAFSVAGLRNSLDDDRGNLTLEFVRLADAIDDLRFFGGKPASIIVWENVPGVLSVKDNAFGCFLGAIVGNDAPLVPTGGKWTNAGMVVGPTRRAAWRVLDAQYFGLAQRRRRVFVVASARDGIDPAEVLFEREGLRRDTPPSRSKGQETAKCLTTGVGQRYDPETETLPVMTNSHVSGTLSANAGGLTRAAGNANELDFCIAQPIALAENIIGRKPENGGNGDGFIDGGPMYTLNATGVHGVAQPIPFGVGENPDLGHCLRSGASKADKHESTTYVAQPITQYGEIAGTLSARHDSSPCADRGQNMVAQPIPINSMNAFRSPDADKSTGVGIGEEGEAMFTLTKGNSHAVAQPMATHEIAGTMISHNGGGGWSNSIDHAASGYMAIQQMAVRRLTPRECERLQGFPDDYTYIPGATDSPRYKALGNSMAVPVMAWIGKRIERHEKF